MAIDLHKNFAYSTLTNAPGTAGTSLIVQSGDGAKFPAVPFNATVWPAGVQPTLTGVAATTAEIVRVTGISTDTLTVTRATTTEPNNTSVNADLAVGDQIAATITAKTLDDAGVAQVSYFYPNFPLLMAATQGIGASAATQTTVTAWVMPMSLAGELRFNNILLAAHNSFSSATTSVSSVNYSYSMGASLGFYTLTGSTMSIVTSFSGSLGYTNASSTNATDMQMMAKVGIGGSSTGKTTTGGANMTAIMSSINSVRQVPLNWTTISNTLTQGMYWAVGCFTQLTAGANQASLTSIGFVSSHSILGSAYNPPLFMQNVASITSPFPFLGQATLVNSSNQLMPASFNTSVITTATASASSTKFQSLWFRIFSSHSN